MPPSLTDLWQENSIKKKTVDRLETNSAEEPLSFIVESSAEGTVPDTGMGGNNAYMTIKERRVDDS
jgi:hypothetical protein